MQQIMTKILKFRDDRDWKQFHTPENLAKSIAIETGELLENFQWNSNFSKENVEGELADILIYSFLLADSIGVNPIDIMSKKIDFNQSRYPVDKAKGNSSKYTKL